MAKGMRDETIPKDLPSKVVIVNLSHEGLKYMNTWIFLGAHNEPSQWLCSAHHCPLSTSPKAQLLPRGGVWHGGGGAYPSWNHSPPKSLTWFT